MDANVIQIFAGLVLVLASFVAYARYNVSGLICSMCAIFGVMLICIASENISVQKNFEEKQKTILERK